jgi:hypothetical protein
MRIFKWKKLVSPMLAGAKRDHASKREYRFASIFRLQQRVVLGTDEPGCGGDGVRRGIEQRVVS